MNQKVFIDSMTNCYNDIFRNAVAAVTEELQKEDLMTDEVKEVLTRVLGTLKPNKKIRKSSTTTQVCGYHIYLREKRKQVAQENPGMLPKEITAIVSRGWSTSTDEQKKEYNDRAEKQKQEMKKASESEASDEETKPKKETKPKEEKPKKESKPKKETKPKEEKPKKETKPKEEKPKKESKPKKETKPKVVEPPSDDEEEEEYPVIVEEDMNSDVDL